jgi:hypothetical protein
MDKIQNMRIGLFALGLFIIGTGIYLITFETFQLEGMIILGAGMGVSLYGYRYKQQREKTIQKPKVKMSFGRILILIGIAIFLLGIVFGLLGLILAYFIGFLLGFLLVVVGRLVITFSDKKAQ